jgi:hypothetical protein
MWVVCLGCGNGFEQEEAVARAQLAKGEIQADEIQHFDHTQVRHLGKCDGCRTESPEAVEVVVRTRGGMAQEAADIQRRLRQLAAAHPDWTRAECSWQAVEDHNSPHLTGSEDFGAWLLERGGEALNATPAWVQDLDGPLAIEPGVS